MKKKAFIKIASVLLSFVAAFCSCKSNGGTTKDDAQFDYFPSQSENLEETGEYIVKDNQSNYQILVPVNADREEKLAASELQFGVESCCGEILPITSTYSTNGKYLSIGKTPLYLEKQAEVNENGLQQLESKVFTIDDDVIMIGYTTEYSLYAVYDFMEKTFGFKWYTYEDYAVQTLDEIKLYKFDFSNIAKMDFRMLFQFEYIGTGDTFVKSRRMRCADYNSDFFMWGHTHQKILPKAVYMEEHPEWYSRNDSWGTTPQTIGQLCLTNEELITEFIRVYKERIQEKLDSGKDCKYSFLGMCDAVDPCQCENCVAFSEELYGRKDDPYQRAGLEIYFANRVAKEINEWIDTIIPGKTIKFMVYAYYQNEKAPIKTLENGQVVAVDDRVIPNEHIMMLYAPLGGDFTYSYDDEERCSEINQILTEWFSITPNVALYNYGCQSGAYMYPFHNLITMEGTYNFALENGAVGCMEENGTQYNWASMRQLKDFVMSQKWWGVEKTTDELAYEFIDFYYKPIASEFKNYYAQLKQFMVYQTEVLGIKASEGSSSYGNTEYWPKGMIDTFEGMLLDMLAKLEPLKSTAPKKYEEYFNRLTVERLWTNYSYLFNHSMYLSIEKNNEIVDFLLDYMAKYGIATHLLGTVSAKRLHSI